VDDDRLPFSPDPSFPLFFPQRSAACQRAMKTSTSRRARARAPFTVLLFFFSQATFLLFFFFSPFSEQLARRLLSLVKGEVRPLKGSPVPLPPPFFARELSFFFPSSIFFFLFPLNRVLSACELEGQDNRTSLASFFPPIPLLFFFSLTPSVDVS